MANRRRLKKEIDYVISDMILDCYTYLSLDQKSNNEEALQIVENTLKLRNELRDKANHPERKEVGTSAKSYYNNIAKTLLGNIDEGYKKLEELVSKAN